MWDPGGWGKPLTGVDGPVDRWMDGDYCGNCGSGYLWGNIIGILGVVGKGVGRVWGFVGDRKECDVCGKMQSATNLARHRARCRQVWDSGGGHRT